MAVLRHRQASEAASRAGVLEVWRRRAVGGWRGSPGRSLGAVGPQEHVAAAPAFLGGRQRQDPSLGSGRRRTTPPPRLALGAQGLRSCRPADRQLTQNSSKPVWIPATMDPREELIRLLQPQMVVAPGNMLTIEEKQSRDGDVSSCVSLQVAQEQAREGRTCISTVCPLFRTKHCWHVFQGAPEQGSPRRRSPAHKADTSRRLVRTQRPRHLGKQSCPRLGSWLLTQTRTLQPLGTENCYHSFRQTNKNPDFLADFRESKSLSPSSQALIAP
ncbi:hypothetical protein QTO34_009690 [Cnephaeus nilssonii]|uniref:Uncharacterized protein n=1 Tax=Cnephaeus nilssonii TaxID=3371016 RepID=A0AA40HJA2_CNENI|nr:hypothetical protein QTO34_009690 [Eptesicus nilssonii]